MQKLIKKRLRNRTLLCKLMLTMIILLTGALSVYGISYKNYVANNNISGFIYCFRTLGDKVLQIIDLETREISKETEIEKEEQYRATYPTIWKDEIIFTSIRISGAEDMYTLKKYQLNSDEISEIYKNDKIVSLASRSPDGSKIAFISRDKYYRENITEIKLLILDLSTNEIKEVPDIKPDLSSPSWSNNNNDVLISTFDDDIYIVNINDNTKKFVSKGKLPSWSPDGKTIAYYKKHSIIIYNLSENKTIKKIRLKYRRIHEKVTPIWSEDSDYIFYVANVREV